jgi:hypothetical protein
MKKLMIIALFGLAALIATDASAWYRRYGRYYNGCGSCYRSCEPCAKTCEPCAEPIKICKTIEEEMPACPRCIKWVPVEAPCNVTRHIYYKCECPAGYTQDGIKEGVTVEEAGKY